MGEAAGGFSAGRRFGPVAAGGPAQRGAGSLSPDVIPLFRKQDSCIGTSSPNTASIPWNFVDAKRKIVTLANYKRLGRFPSAYFSRMSISNSCFT
jgi:hypothetical protein